MTDLSPVTMPAHYQFSGEIQEVRDVIRERTVVYLDNDLPAEGIYDYNSAIKYILRAPAKNGIEDLKKAKYCIDSLLGILEANDDDKECSIFDPDVMADVIVRMKDAMQDKREEMDYNVLTRGMLTTEFDKLTGMCPHRFNG